MAVKVTLGLDKLIERTGIFHGVVAKQLSGLRPYPDDRVIVAFQAAVLSFEHATGALILIAHDLCAPAFSLYRPQFESVVRGIWLLHAASDAWVRKLNEPLTIESAKRANEGLMLSDMLKELANSDAPVHLQEQLRQYRDVTWKALNSYSHGGLHPLSRTLTGYPEQLASDALRNSNGIVALTAQLGAILSGDGDNMQPVREMHEQFRDCIPIV